MHAPQLTTQNFVALAAQQTVATLDALTAKVKALFAEPSPAPSPAPAPAPAPAAAPAAGGGKLAAQPPATPEPAPAAPASAAPPGPPAPSAPAPAAPPAAPAAARAAPAAAAPRPTWPPDSWAWLHTLATLACGKSAVEVWGASLAQALAALRRGEEGAKARAAILSDRRFQFGLKYWAVTSSLLVIIVVVQATDPNSIVISRPNLTYTTAASVMRPQVRGARPVPVTTACQDAIAGRVAVAVMGAGELGRRTCVCVCACVVRRWRRRWATACCA